MSTVAQLLIGGERISGESIRSQNGEGPGEKRYLSTAERVERQQWVWPCSYVEYVNLGLCSI